MFEKVSVFDDVRVTDQPLVVTIESCVYLLSAVANFAVMGDSVRADFVEDVFVDIDDARILRRWGVSGGDEARTDSTWR
ncbi:hypothetical protein Z052_08775 [Halorubrum sp. C191]|uniref:hypothetical protein n=1 Tax=Halorubrum sp. C191 TaxID=1383842 RepID=UPI000C06E4C0|nr:hypothetical protein [Halorubrum sp. C191]PHQ42561.1 hypothetical protein Z052_08775 [Halorubrum sp. C191]